MPFAEADSRGPGSAALKSDRLAASGSTTGGAERGPIIHQRPYGRPADTGAPAEHCQLYWRPHCACVACVPRLCEHFGKDKTVLPSSRMDLVLRF